MRDAPMPSAASSPTNFRIADPNGQLRNRARRLWRRFYPPSGRTCLSELPHALDDSAAIPVNGLATLVDGRGKARGPCPLHRGIYGYRDRRWLAVAGRAPCMPEAAKMAISRADGATSTRRARVTAVGAPTWPAGIGGGPAVLLGVSKNDTESRRRTLRPARSSAPASF